MWKPIETAPKDTEIVVCFVNDYGYQETPTVYGPYTAKYSHGEWMASWDDCLVIESSGYWGTEYMKVDLEPTHWMEKPDVARLTHSSSST